VMTEKVSIARNLSPLDGVDAAKISTLLPSRRAPTS
jgi:hypothetical protein